MAIQERNEFNNIQLNSQLEQTLKQSRHELQERKQSIILGIDSHAMAARKEVQHHISMFIRS